MWYVFIHSGITGRVLISEKSMERSLLTNKPEKQSGSTLACYKSDQVTLFCFWLVSIQFL